MLKLQTKCIVYRMWILLREEERRWLARVCDREYRSIRAKLYLETSERPLGVPGG
jgi:hypothetical protein